jgi:hypothetical protein
MIEPAWSTDLLVTGVAPVSGYCGPLTNTSLHRPTKRGARVLRDEGRFGEALVWYQRAVKAGGPYASFWWRCCGWPAMALRDVTDETDLDWLEFTPKSRPTARPPQPCPDAVLTCSGHASAITRPTSQNSQEVQPAAA